MRREYSLFSERSQALLCLSLDQEDITKVLNERKLFSLCLQADLIELRFFNGKDTAVSPQTVEFLERVKKPILARLVSFHNNAKIIELLQALPYEPRIIDIPDERGFKTALHTLRSHFPEALIQLSHHDESPHSSNFKTAYDIREYVEERLLSSGADLVKCAFYPSDIKLCLEFLSSMKSAKRKQPVTVIAMGNRYSFFRVLAHFFGNLLTFTCLPGMQKAPGQIDIDTLINSYSLLSVADLTHLYGLIGSPVEASLSHFTHTRMLHELGVKKALYVKLDVQKEECDEIFISLLRRLSFRGLSVTTPLKEKIASYVNSARGSIPLNTIFFEENGDISGLNSDVRALTDALTLRGGNISTKIMAVIGSGDVAYSCAAHFLRDGWRVYILARSYEKALERFLDIHATVLPLFESRNIADVIGEASCIINTLPWDGSQDLLSSIPPKRITASAIVAEFAYPEKSGWLKEIEKRGHRRAICGYELWVRQAAWQLHEWTRQSSAAIDRVDVIARRLHSIVVSDNKSLGAAYEIHLGE